MRDENDNTIAFKMTIWHLAVTDGYILQMIINYLLSVRAIDIWERAIGNSAQHATIWVEHNEENDCTFNMHASQQK